MEVDLRFQGEMGIHKPLDSRGLYQVYFKVEENGTKYYSEN